MRRRGGCGLSLFRILPARINLHKFRAGCKLARQTRCQTFEDPRRRQCYGCVYSSSASLSQDVSCHTPQPRRRGALTCFILYIYRRRFCVYIYIKQITPWRAAAAAGAKTYKTLSSRWCPQGTMRAATCHSRVRFTIYIYNENSSRPYTFIPAENASNFIYFGKIPYSVYILVKCITHTVLFFSEFHKIWKSKFTCVVEGWVNCVVFWISCSFTRTTRYAWVSRTHKHTHRHSLSLSCLKSGSIYI